MLTAGGSGAGSTLWRAAGRFAAALLLAVPAAAQTSPASVAAAAPTPASFSFALAEVAKTCTELAGGVRVEVRNETGSAQKVSVVLGQFTSDKGSVVGADSVCGRVSANPNTLPLAAGETGVTVLKAGARATNGTKYTGTLAAAAAGEPVARLPLKLAATTPTPTPAAKSAPEPLVETITATLFSDDEPKIVWIPVKVKANEEVALGSRQALGAVSGEPGSATAVYADHKRPLSVGTSELKVELVGLDEVGSYDGKLDLLPDDKERGVVVLKLTHKEGWAEPIALLLLGIIAALIAQRLAGVTIARRRLRARLAATGPRYRKAGQRLAGAANGQPWGGYRFSNLKARRDAIEERINTESRAAYTSITTAKIDEISKEIEQLEKEIDLLDSVHPHASALDAALEDLRGLSPITPLDSLGLDVVAEPAYVAKAWPLLVGAPMTGEKLKTRLAAIEEATTTARQLHSYAVTIAEQLRRLAILADRLPDKADEIVDLRFKVLGALHNIWVANERSQLVDLHVAEDVNDVGRAIGRLWAELEPDESRRDRLYVERDAAEGMNVEVLGFWPEPEPIDYTESGVQKELNVARVAQLVLVALAVALALVTGLEALYIGKPFGSDWDYVKTFTWGLGTQATVAAVAVALDALAGLGLIGRQIRPVS